MDRSVPQPLQSDRPAGAGQPAPVRPRSMLDLKIRRREYLIQMMTARIMVSVASRASAPTLETSFECAERIAFGLRSLLEEVSPL
jgi:hypothetical protein